MAGATAMSFFEELKRRSVFKVGIAYAVAAWVLLQFVDIVLENIQAPEWIMQVFMLALAIGFPLAIFFAWAFEMTPDGVKREKDVDRSQIATPTNNRKLDRSIILVLFLAVVFLLYKQLNPSPPDSPTDTVAGPATQTDSIANEQVANVPVTIAVLPFVNMSSDPEQEYFSDGITEEILNRLAKIRQLQVVARTSVFSFKGQNQDIREIGELLGVGTILEGSVRRDGEQVRITAQLIRTSDGFHLWSETYDRKLENIFAIQDDIASQIAAALEVSLGINEIENNAAKKPVNPQVYDLYLRARALHRNRGEGLIEALSLFRQALDIDPNFAPAWAGLAHSYNVISYYISRQQLAAIGDPIELSLAATQQALKLDPELATALHAMGNYQLEQHEWAEAQTYYERALQLDPGSTDIMEDYSNMLQYSLQVDAAVKVAERMIKLDPFVPIFLQVGAGISNTAGDYERRNALIKTLVSIAPEFRFSIGWILQTYFEDGQLEEMHRYIDGVDLKDWTTLEGMHKAINWLGNSQKNPDDAILQALLWRPRLAMMANRPDIYFELLSNLSNSQRYPHATVIFNPNLPADETRIVRELPQSKAFLKALKLPEFWRKTGWPDICSPIGEDDFECH
jgi:TolB-like protein